MKLFNSTNRKLFIILYTCRSGSTFLCELCGNVGFGFPLEYYYPYEHAERYQYWIKNLPNYGRHLSTGAKAGANQYLESVIDLQPHIAGIKCTIDSWNILQAEAYDLLKQIKPNIIHLTRQNKIQQAISWYRAAVTNRWSSNDITDVGEPPYNAAKITYYLDILQDHERRLEDAVFDMNPLRLSYENLTLNTIQQIATHIGQPIPYPWNAKVSVKIQRTPQTEEWATRYANTHQ